MVQIHCIAGSNAGLAIRSNPPTLGIARAHVFGPIFSAGIAVIQILAFVVTPAGSGGGGVAGLGRGREADQVVRAGHEALQRATGAEVQALVVRVLRARVHSIIGRHARIAIADARAELGPRRLTALTAKGGRPARGTGALVVPTVFERACRQPCAHVPAVQQIIAWVHGGTLILAVTNALALIR